MSIRIEFQSRRTGKGSVIDLHSNDERFLGTEGDIVIGGEGVCARHARIFTNSSGLHIEPVDGASLALNGKPVYTPVPLANGDWLALGSAFLQIKISGDSLTGSVPQTQISTLSQSRSRIREISIGRLPQCDLAITSPLVSRHHANLFQDNGAVVLQDLNSTNGTFVNGRRIMGQVTLQRGDRVGIATFAFVFTGEALEPVDEAGRVHLEARKLCKEVPDRSTGKPRRLLDSIDLVVEPGEFVAIFGTSGSGKSTLLDALNGRRPATTGQILYNGTDFYSAFDLFRAAIGYVPQQDIVHRRISVEHALRYTARLRLPSDTSDEEIDEHIVRVLHQVGLGDKALCPIDTPSPLSGGQLKRVSLAVELIANPNILFLDEVTSGLDAGTDKKMMQLFAELAAEQKIVICVTHTLENIQVCRLVLLLHQGKTVYFGPPEDALGYFGVSRLSDVYELIESRSSNDWAEKFLRSPYYETYIKNRFSPIQTEEQVQQPGHVESIKVRQHRSRWSQWVTLMRRYVDLMLADRKNLAILLLQAPFIAVLIGLVFDTSGTLEQRVAGESQIAFILVLSAIWCGCLNSTREVVKELPIYLRERAVNLGIGPYLFSKLLPLSLLCLIQCLSLLGIVTVLTSWAGDFGARLGTLFLAGMAATTMGLAVSTLVDSNDKAAALIPILLIPQVILSNFIVRLGKVGETVAQATIIAFSSFDAMNATFSEEIAPLVTTQKTFATDLGIVSALGIGFLLAALLGLKLKDRRR